MSRPASAVESLCLACGLCCDGTLFADVELQPADEPERLRQRGLRLLRRPARKELLPDAPGLRFRQPCAALAADCHCQVYADRPAQCRTFECALLKEFLAGTADEAEARRVIRKARRLANSARGLLRALGDTREDRPLSRRFREMRRALEGGRLPAGLTAEQAYEQLADLMLAVQELQLLLRLRFYPDPAD